MPENLAQTLGRISGQGEKVVNEIWEQVKANHTKLDACPRHYFERIEPDKPLSKYRCTSCGGELDGINAVWYRKGLEHAGA